MYCDPSINMYWQGEDTDKENIAHTETNVGNIQLLTMTVTYEQVATKNVSLLYFSVWTKGYILKFWRVLWKEYISKWKKYEHENVFLFKTIKFLLYCVSNGIWHQPHCVTGNIIVQ